MRITDLLDPRSISLTATPKTKSEALDQLVDLMCASGKINDKEAYRKQVYAREEESTTGIGLGIGIPHGKCDAVDKPGLAAMVVKNGVDFEALDDAPVTLLFLIAAPNTEDNVHLSVLSKLSVMMMDQNFSDSLRNAGSVEEFLEIIDQADDEKKSIDERLADTGEAKENSTKILAVTSCPTGIAHTYMAAEGLETAAKAKGCFIKVETRGSGGAKNVLTAKEIEEADCIIVAADAKVPMDRFAGKKVIECQVSDGISKADQLIDRAIAGDAPIYKSGSESSINTEVSKSGKGIGHQIYTQLMNGVSHMLPFVVGGGILIAIAFLIDGLNVDINSLPADQRINFGTITPMAAMFKSIGGTAFGFMLPVLAGYIAMAIADRPVLIYPVVGILIIGIFMTYVVEPIMGGINTGVNSGLEGMAGSSKILLGLILGGMMSIDMGGPFNKAAYVFGVAQIAAGNYDIMATVMIGGMVPPCAIALATLLFKDKFTKEEREAGPTNFIMGLAFITEGAIPFAASDPLHVLPACIIGSGLAGALSMVFNCTLMAPHGGIFVFPVVGNGLMYFVALVAGTIVSAVLLGALNKKVA